MVAEPPSLHAVLSWGRCGRGVPPPTGGGLGGLPQKILEFLSPRVHFGPFLANLAFCFSS